VRLWEQKDHGTFKRLPTFSFSLYRFLNIVVPPADLPFQYSPIIYVKNLEIAFLVVSGLLSLREDDTRRVGAIFVGLFFTQCHANLRGWGYKFIAASQPRIC
jgi:hypothetical protein